MLREQSTTAFSADFRAGGGGGGAHVKGMIPRTLGQSPEAQSPLTPSVLTVCATASMRR